MNKSLYSKLVLIMLVLIISIMSVVGAFLVNEIRSFYLEDFYAQMKSVFETPGLADDLYSVADNNDAPESMFKILKGYFGQMGIDSRSRNVYILKGDTGSVIVGAEDAGDKLAITPNIYTAIGGAEGYQSDLSAPYMDVAIPIAGSSSNYIIYIKDNKSTVSALSSTLFSIIAEAMIIGLAISVILSLLLAKTMVTPIQSLTRAAEKVASGDFSGKLESDSNDEIGVLTRTFNNMANQLEKNIDDLRKSEAMRREFVANVSHELRTPITNIRSYAETLQENTNLPPEKAQNFLGVIVSESDRMTKIVQDLLTLSRFDAGSYAFTFEKFSLEKSLNSVYSAMLMEAQRHSHQFTLDIKNPLPPIIGDKARIEQVLINMISNAIKYTHDGGRIAIQAGIRDELVWISVRDNGIGIPQEDVSKVFDRFYRVDKARSRESGGTGLGLSIAKEIVFRHNGNISLTSRQGKGTVITISLPVGGPADEK